MLTRLLKAMGHKPEKSDTRHLLSHAKALKHCSTLWRKGKKKAEADGLVDIDGYFRRDFSGLLDKHAKAYEKVALLIKLEKSERDAAAIKSRTAALKSVISKLSPVLDLYTAMLAGGLTAKTRALAKEHGKSGGKLMPKDEQLKSTIGALSVVIVFEIKERISKALESLAPYVRSA